MWPKPNTSLDAPRYVRNICQGVDCHSTVLIALGATSVIGHRFLYLLLGLVALISTLALLGMVYQVIATRLDQRKYPPPGRLVEVGGYRLHIHCSGPEGVSGPTVVMDAGIGECSLGWGL